MSDDIIHSLKQRETLNLLLGVDAREGEKLFELMNINSLEKLATVLDAKLMLKASVMQVGAEDTKLEIDLMKNASMTSSRYTSNVEDVDSTSITSIIERLQTESENAKKKDKEPHSKPK